MAFALGTMSKGRELSLTDEERSRHIHIVGASGTGKSKLLEAMIRQDLLAGHLSGRGLCLIDPHGTLADAIIEWCAAMKIDKYRRIHIIDPKNRDWVPGFNPLRFDGVLDLNARVDAMVATCAEVWGGEDINQTPLLTTCLQIVFYALAAHGLTLVEAIELTSSTDPYAIRQRLTGTLPDPVFESFWRDFNKLSTKEFEERFSSTRRRLLRFLGAPSIRRIVGQRQRTLDFRRVMDEGDVVIVNLAARGSLSEENARLLGAMITSELRLAAMSRDASVARDHPFSLYIDECYDYLTGDVEAMLDQTRKFGLHVILAHQRLAQLRKRSEAIYNGVMAGGQTKIVFGGMNDEDAEIMAKEVYRSSFKLERPKRALDKPVVVDEIPYWLDSESWTTSDSTTTSDSSTASGSDTSNWSSITNTSSVAGDSFGPDDDNVRGSTLSEGTGSSEGIGGSSSEGWARTSGEARTSGASESHGRSQTMRPVRVIMTTAVHSLDEELHLAIVKLRELPNQAAIVKRRGRPPVRIKPATVKPALAWEELTDQFIDTTRAASPYISSAPQADAEIAMRFDTLRAKETKPMPDAAGSEAFWTE